jgi:hypothetical protein
MGRPINGIKEILPSFVLLPLDMQKWLIKLSSATPIHWGHAYHFEGGERMYANFAEVVGKGKVTSELLDAGYLIHLCDTAASQAHLNPVGSLALTEATYQGYKMIRGTLGRMLLNGLSVDEALKDSLAAKASMVKAMIGEDPCDKFLIRMTGWLRLHTPEDYQLLKHAVTQVPPEDLQLAIEQFNMEGGFNLWQRNPTYGPTVLLNLANFQAPQEDRQIKINRALEGACCLARWTKHYAEKVKDSNEPVNFNGMAGIAASQPELFKLKNFNVLEFELDAHNKVAFKKILSSVQSRPASPPLTWDRDRHAAVSTTMAVTTHKKVLRSQIF